MALILDLVGKQERADSEESDGDYETVCGCAIKSRRFDEGNAAGQRGGVLGSPRHGVVGRPPRVARWRGWGHVWP